MVTIWGFAWLSRVESEAKKGLRALLSSMRTGEIPAEDAGFAEALVCSAGCWMPLSGAVGLAAAGARGKRRSAACRKIPGARPELRSLKRCHP